MGVQLGISVYGVEGILEGFSKLSVGVQRKYLRAAVNKVSKPHMAAVKALVARGPTGNLKRSVGVMTEAKKKGRTQTAILGFRRGEKNKDGTAKKSSLGFHAWWIENGVKARAAKGGKMLQVPGTLSRKYPYLAGKVTTGGDGSNAAYFRQVRGFRGTGKFEQWADSTLPQIRDALQDELVKALAKAIAQQARRDAKSSERPTATGRAALDPSVFEEARAAARRAGWRG